MIESLEDAILHRGSQHAYEKGWHHARDADAARKWCVNSVAITGTCLSHRRVRRVTVMLLLNGIQAWIEVEGVELEQYSIEHSPNGDSVTCWIVCEEGKNFSVCWKNMYTTPRPGAAVHGKVIVDGHNCGAKRVWSNHTGTVRMSGVRTSDTSIRPFLFSTLELTDDDNYLMLSAAAAENLGNISLQVSDVLGPVKEGLDRRHDRPYGIPSMDHKIHERLKKSLAHCVKFGEEQQTAKMIPAPHQPLSSRATFVFRYRSINVLMANGIVPMPPSGEKRAAEDSPELKHDSDEDRDEELRALEERIKAIKAAKTKHNRKKKIKTENIEIKHIPGDVIDLT